MVSNRVGDGKKEIHPRMGCQIRRVRGLDRTKQRNQRVSPGKEAGAIHLLIAAWDRPRNVLHLALGRDLIQVWERGQDLTLAVVRIDVDVDLAVAGTGNGITHRIGYGEPGECRDPSQVDTAISKCRLRRPRSRSLRERAGGEERMKQNRNPRQIR